MVVIDEAYIDFGGDSAAFTQLIAICIDNLLVIQTLSKSRHSLAGNPRWVSPWAVGVVPDRGRSLLRVIRIRFQLLSPGCLAQRARPWPPWEDEDYFR